MTAAMAEATTRGVARRGRGVWVALALSLTLNVCFIGGLVWAMLAVERVEAPAQRFVAVGRSLDLTPVQRAALNDFAITSHNAAHTLRDNNAPLMQQIWSEMAKPTPDEAAIAGIVDATTQNRRTYQRAMTHGLLTFLATLTPDQRSQFATLAHRPEPDGRRSLRFSIP